VSQASAPQTPERNRAVRSRRGLRRWLLVGFAPVALVGMLLVVKLLSMYAFAHQAITAHVERNPAGTVAAAQGQLPVNWFEAYLAPYNYGVGLATSDELEAARAQFEAALPLAKGYDACPVHINLGLVIEMMADKAQSDDPKRAAELYADALDANLATPEECRSDEADEQSPDPDRSNEETLDDQQERLQQKQQEQQSGGGESEDDSEQDEKDEQSEQEKQEQDDKLGEIEKKLREGEQERENQGSNGDEDGEGGYGSDKPW